MVFLLKRFVKNLNYITYSFEERRSEKINREELRSGEVKRVVDEGFKPSCMKRLSNISD